jgi:hypothetical protein
MATVVSSLHTAEGRQVSSQAGAAVTHDSAEDSVIVDEAPEGEATLLSCVLNQANTVLGAGMLR